MLQHNGDSISYHLYNIIVYIIHYCYNIIVILFPIISKFLDSEYFFPLKIYF